MIKDKKIVTTTLQLLFEKKNYCTYDHVSRELITLDNTNSALNLGIVGI